MGKKLGKLVKIEKVCGLVGNVCAELEKLVKSLKNLEFQDIRLLLYLTYWVCQGFRHLGKRNKKNSVFAKSMGKHIDYVTVLILWI